MGYEVKKYEHIEELNSYFQDVQRFSKRLTFDEEKSLGYRIQNGDEECINDLVKPNLPFVITIAKKYRKFTDVSFADLIAEGNIGLIKAAKTFNPEKNVRFSSYAVWWIKASIRECIDKYKNKLENNAIDDSVFNNTSSKENLYENINEEFEKNINNILSRRSAVEELIGCLEEREKKIIMLFFGLGETEREMNLEEISQELCLTKERIRQIKDSALVKMKCEALCSSECNVYRNLY